MGNPFKRDSAPAPTPAAEKVVETPKKQEVQTARTQAKESLTGIGRRRGNLGRISSLLSGGYRGFGMGENDRLG